MVEQSRELIEKANNVLLKHCDELVKISPGMGSREFNVRILYSHLYGNLPKRDFTITLTKDDNSIKFVDGSTESSSVDDKYHSSLVKKNFAYFDTCYKLGVEFFPLSKTGIYITDIGLIELTNYGRRIADSMIIAIGDVDVYADTKENAQKLVETFMENVVDVECDNSKVTRYLWVKRSYDGLAAEDLEFDRFDINLKKNYNDDIPYDKLVELINSNNKELILLNGKPGTGKTSLIKHLMGITKNKFLYIDSALLLGGDTSKFIDFMLNFRNSVVVLEDCEKILSQREDGNPFMGILLNLTDGIIGETIKPKFICSFNCSENKIDKALLRKGRLSLKYTFNELSLEKTKAIMPEATKPMTLAEIYNKDVTNTIGVPERKKIGF